MDNVQFSKSFAFNGYSFKQSRHTDNSCGTRFHHIGVIKKGSAVLDLGDERHEFFEGDVFYTPLGCRYHSYWSGEKIEYDSYAFLHFISEGEAYGVQRLTLTPEARSALDYLNGHKEVTTRTVGALYLLLGEAQPFMQPSVRDGRRETLAEAMRYMREDVGMSVPELARLLHMSESGLYALFSEQGTTPVTEKNRIRVEQARELLESTDLSVEEISERLGFSSAAYFRKVFRTQTGQTPSVVRRTLRNSTRLL